MSSPGRSSCRCSPGSARTTPGLLERAAHRPPRRLFEYWGHAASLIDVTLQPLLRFRMQAGFRDVWAGVERVARANPHWCEFVREEVAARGPISARQLEVEEERDRSNWGWNWSGVKTVLEWLFYCGEVASAYRNSQFERVYDLPERVLPPAVLAAPTPTPEESVVGLVRRAAQALGVASEFCLRDYFRTRAAMTREAIATLVETGELIPVTVPAWEGRPCYLWHQARLPRRIAARALLSPFDSMIFERSRLERLFDFVVPDRDLRSGTEADPRVLRLSVPAGRVRSSPGSTSRPTGPAACCG